MTHLNAEEYAAWRQAAPKTEAIAESNVLDCVADLLQSYEEFGADDEFFAEVHELRGYWDTYKELSSRRDFNKV